MNLPLTIQFIGLSPSREVEAAIQGCVADVNRDCPDVAAWRVTVVQEGFQHLQERPYSVLVAASVAEQDLSVVQVHDDDVRIAVREAFDDIKRELKDAARLRRHHVKQHEAMSLGHAG
jgi:hypothetical protein